MALFTLRVNGRDRQVETEPDTPLHGRKDWPDWSPLQRIWEFVHHRVTTNVLNRVKQLCEWRFWRTRQAS